jgi:hypothetical protein
MPKGIAAGACLVAASILAIDAGGSLAARGRIVARLSLPSEGVMAGRTATATVTVTRVARGDAIWVPNRDAATDPRGLSAMEALLADDRGVWLADNTRGVLYRVPG